ncbi:MAG: hypothetical protein KDD52_00860 [Bdellovibrionales bacterium]|nr:hypothetical protein [Bdellovibrionales bacterium]
MNRLSIVWCFVILVSFPVWGIEIDIGKNLNNIYVFSQNNKELGIMYAGYGNGFPKYEFDALDISDNAFYKKDRLAIINFLSCRNKVHSTFDSELGPDNGVKDYPNRQETKSTIQHVYTCYTDTIDRPPYYKIIKRRIKKNILFRGNIEKPEINIHTMELEIEDDRNRKIWISDAFQFSVYTDPKDRNKKTYKENEEESGTRLFFEEDDFEISRSSGKVFGTSAENTEGDMHFTFKP